jgi:ribosomal protein L40E
MSNSVAVLHPLVRALVIAMLIVVPILLVILPRLGEIRKLLKRPKIEVQAKQDIGWPFKYGADKNVSICPKCYRQNPPDNKFCGFCGSEMIFLKKEN